MSLFQLHGKEVWMGGWGPGRGPQKKANCKRAGQGRARSVVLAPPISSELSGSNGPATPGKSELANVLDIERGAREIRAEAGSPLVALERKGGEREREGCARARRGRLPGSQTAQLSALRRGAEPETQVKVTNVGGNGPEVAAGSLTHGPAMERRVKGGFFEKCDVASPCSLPLFTREPKT